MDPRDIETMRDEYLRMAAQIGGHVHKAYEGAIRMARGRPERLADIQRAMLADYERSTRHIVSALGDLPPMVFISDSDTRPEDGDAKQGSTSE